VARQPLTPNASLSFFVSELLDGFCVDAPQVGFPGDYHGSRFVSSVAFKGAPRRSNPRSYILLVGIT
jgi:hypothetical protein